VYVSCPRYIKVNTKMNKLLNEINKTRIKIYYNLNELTDITGLKTRALKYRMSEVKEKYTYIPHLLRKEGRSWKIHYTLIIEFMPKYTSSTKTIYNENWISTSTWNPKNNYSIDYHVQLVYEVKAQLPEHKIAYTIEMDKRGVHHVHLMSTAQTIDLANAVEIVLGRYLDIKKECMIQTTNIHNKYSLFEYLKKASLGGAILQ
jgi:hypothetical protein